MNLLRVLQLTSEMISLADDGDSMRSDRECGVIYGILRDTAYKLRNLSAKEIEAHRDLGKWHMDSELLNQLNQLLKDQS